MEAGVPTGYPVAFSVDYPDRPLDRLTTGFRIFVAIPILIVAATLGGEGSSYYGAPEASTGLGRGRSRRGPRPRPAADDPVPSEVPAVVVRLEPRVLRFENRVAPISR